MRIMTYNILTGGQEDFVYSRWDRIVEVVREQHPDVLVLNECNFFELQGSRRLHCMERALSMRGLLGEADTGFHVAVFVSPSAEIVENRVTRGKVHHAVQKVDLLWAGKPLTIVAAHLCPFSGHSRLQEAQFLSSFARPGESVILAGDLNSISPRDTSFVDTRAWESRRLVRHVLPHDSAATLPVLDTRAIQALETAGYVDLGAAGGDYTPTVLTPLKADFQAYQLRIDYLLATAPVAERLRRAWVVTSTSAQAASDHYPVCADLELD